MIDFPASPTVGQTFSAAGLTWTWTGVVWTSAGGVSISMGDNRLINGDMRIDQRNNGASGTASGYTIDRWVFTATQPSKFTWGRNLNSVAVVNAANFIYYFGVQSSSAFTPAAGDTFLLQQNIEADTIGDLAFSQPNAQPVTLSFWAYSSLTGTFSGALCNSPSAATRSYPFTYSIPVANTWTKIAVTIPGDTGGAWTLSTNALGMQLRFDLGSGATFRAAAGAWGNGNIVGANGAVNVVATNGATFYVTGVKLEIGSVATPYPRQSLAKSMADCQRYYCARSVHLVGGTGASGIAFYIPYTLPVTMRALPTVVLTMTGGGGYSSPSVANVAADGISVTATSSTNYLANMSWTASAEL
jgi:hypothetical protein